jgi:RND family efflux transporter MFP subunit
MENNPQISSFSQKIRSHKKIAIVAAIIIIGGVGFWFYKVRGTTTAAVRYVTAAAQTGTLTTSVSGTGQVAASNQVTINPQGSGSVTAVYVKEGETVKAGQAIAALDQSNAVNQINSAKAALASAQANLNSVMAGTISTDITLAQLNVQSAQKALDNAQTNYTQVSAQQDLAIAKAYTNLLNDNLQAVSSDAFSTVPVTISGSYTGTAQGAYTIQVYQGGDGLHYQVGGLGSGGGTITRGVAQSIGNGLYVTFGSTGTISPNATWTINLPNTQSSSYVSDMNAYSTAQGNKTQAIQQAQQQIDSAQNSLLQSQTQLAAKQAPPTDAQVNSAKAQVSSAQASLTSAQTAYANNVVKAPFDGVIATLSLQVGQQAGSGTAAAVEITQQEIAQITLNEVDAAKVSIGQKATLTFTAVSGLSVSGKVAEVQSVGTVSQNVVNFPVKIALDTQDPRVKPGMSVSASIITAVAQNVLTVPSTAVKSDANGSYVQVLVNGQPQPVAVITGLTNNTNTEISGNIKEGDEVVTQTITATSTAKPSTTQSGNILQTLGAGGRTGGTGGGGSGGRGAAGGGN